MKINKTISVDLEAWTSAQTRVDNISSYLNECLINATRTTNDKTERDLELELDQVKHEMNELAIKHALLMKLLNDAKANKVAQIKANEELEQFKRWKCGACKHLNFMDSIRCNGCGLPTRHDSKTVEVMTNDVPVADS